MSDRDSHTNTQASLEAVQEVAQAALSGDQEGLTAALAALRQASSQLDLQALLDTPLIPQDAGEHAEGLARIIARIPEGWGRWISCGPGWYPLLVELDEQIATLWPTYEVHQVKEKFGTLRYYLGRGPSTSFELALPRPSARDCADPEALQTARRAYDKELRSWQQSEAGEREVLALEAAAERVWPQIDELVRQAEARSAETCERCGSPGALRDDGWLVTLCDRCDQVRPAGS